MDGIKLELFVTEYGELLIISPEPKADWSAYMIGKPPSSIVCRLSVRRPYSLNIFSSEITYEKMCIKSEVEEILFKLATNDHSDEAFLLTSKFLALMGRLPLARDYV